MSVIKLARGIQGIGKSTWALEEYCKPNTVRVSKDFLREMEAPTYNESHPELVDNMMHAFIEEAIKMNLDVVVDNTFCFMKHIDDIVLRYSNRAKIEIYEFPNDYERAFLQNDKRKGRAYINPKIIRDFSVAFEKSKPALQTKYASTREVFMDIPLNVYHVPMNEFKVHDPTLNGRQLAFVFDIDQTLSKKCDRGVYDYSKCINDEVILSTAYILGGLEEINLKDPTLVTNIFVTGRGEECRHETMNWLQSAVDDTISSNRLYMRPLRDFRRDSIVKAEIYNNKLRDKFNILGWFDDSPKVIKEFLIPYKIPFFDTTYCIHQ